MPGIRLKARSRIEIKILNPPQGTRSFTSLPRARRYVRQGRASWADHTHESITFVEHDPRHQAVARRVDETGLGYKVASETHESEYSRLRRMIANLPMSRPEIGMGMGQTRHR